MKGREETEGSRDFSSLLAPQGALEQRSPLNVCLGDVHSLLLALQELMLG